MLTSGTKLGPYEIQSSLGAGGMGEVYRATDTKLGRDIALKVLPAEMAQDPERLARFRREAKTLAQLDHPNIVTIHSVEECDGIHFLTMQLVEGMPLDRVIPLNGLPVEQLCEIANALGDALAAAHEKGIIHRDLKPANVMISSEGRVKVLDFGLAKDVREVNPSNATMTSDSHTQIGVVMGTPAYMSPEQTSGRPLDHRTDIFSLGVLLHEMATGHRPFEGASSAELISAILRDTPPSVTDARPDLPSDLARVIRRCLEKDPRHRVQTARDVSNEFRDLARQTSQKSRPASSLTSRTSAPDSSSARVAVREDEGFWVAVLPFKYSGSNAELAALAEGLTDDIVTNMSKFSYLRVIARSSTARYAQRSADVRTAARELGARYVMEGSIRQAGSKVRIAVQLVDANSGASLWAETYDHIFDPETTLELLDDVVPRIVATVGDTQGILAHSMTDALRNRDPESLTPYEALLRSFGFHQHVSAEEHLAGVTALEHAVKQAPDRADCWAMLGWLYRAEYTHGYNVRPDSMDRAITASRRAVNLAPSNQMAHAALASAHFYRRELGAFRAAAERALQLNRMEGYTTAFMGMHFAFSGDWERGCALSQRSTQLNPNHPGWYWLPMVLNAYRLHDSERALELALRVAMPGLWTVQVANAVIYSQLGQIEQAGIALRALLELRPDFGAIAKQELSKWWMPDMVEQMLGDLRKAGLDVSGSAIQPTASPVTNPVRAILGEARADEGFWVAVLPFKYAGAGAELKALADGLSEEIVTGLSRFSYLRVIARGSTAKYSSESGDVRAIGKELGARYVMEGSLRQAGTKLRLAVQLIDAVSGSHLWAENYERPFSTESVFELQDDLVPRVVCTVADSYGVLPYSMSDLVRSKAPDQLTPYEAVLRGIGYGYRVTPEEHAIARTCLERAVEQQPGYADGWAMLSLLYSEEHGMGFNAQPEPLERALQAGQRSVEAAPSNSLAQGALAKALFFRKEFQAFQIAAERAISLNPMDGATLANSGSLLAYSGEWERGCALMERAMQLNPRHPGWCWFPAFFNAYRKGDYRGAVSIGLKINLPGFFATHEAMAAAYGQLGEREAASQSLDELLKLVPNFGMIGRALKAKWFGPEMVEHVMDGLRKAGLEIADDPAKLSISPANATSTSATLSATLAKTDSGSTRADEGFWVAVLPFKCAAANAGLKALADGLSEEIVTGLSRFSYLRVIARGSTAKYSSESGDVRTIGKELGARYVMEGSLRQSGTKLRLAVQLVDAVSGAHLWAENYERAFSAETVFELQDDLVPRIVSTVADMNGILPRSMSEGLRSRLPDQLSPYETVLRSFVYTYSATPEELAAARSALEEAVGKAPAYSDAWAMLSFLCGQDYVHGYELQANALEIATSAARRAVALGASNHLAYFSLGQALWCQKDYDSFRDAAERAVVLNPMDGNSVAYLGELLIYAGSAERGLELVERAKQLNPNHPGWYWFADFYHAYSQGDYRNALSFALKAKLRGNPLAPMFLAAAYGQLGDVEGGEKAAAELVKFRPELPALMRKQVAKVWNPEYGERFLEGLRKAGMQIPEGAVSVSQKSLTPPTPSTLRTGAVADSGAARANVREDEGFWVAVLPFKYSGNNAEITALAEGLTEDIITGLSRFSYLKVVAHNSAMVYKGRAADIRTVGRKLGARYVIEGSIRKRDRAIRVSAQLMDAVSGAQLWAETYDREILDHQGSDAGTFQVQTFQVQDDLTDHIVTTVADGYGVLVRSMAAPIRDRQVEELSASELVLRHYAFMQQVNPQEHALLRGGLERAVEREPHHAAAWACLSNLYQLEYFDRFNPLEKPMERAREAAWRAVKIDPACQMGWKELAAVHFFSRDYTTFRETAERAISLNPRDGTTLAMMAIMIAFSGDWERGMALSQRAIDLNRHHPGWYHNVSFHHYYRKRDYEAALRAAKKINMPEFHWMHLAIAASCGMLGRHEEARTAIESLRRFNPAFLDLENVRADLGTWDPDKDEVEHFLQGLQKAGLKYGLAHSAPAEIEPKPKSAPAAALVESGATRAAIREEEGFWVAVLPFKYAGTGTELRTLAEGLSEEIITGLSRFSYLRVIARGSTTKYSSESGDVRAIGKELGARYVMEGSLRQAGTKLRLAVQLADTVSGAHLWAETYERAFTSESIFEVQDDLVPRVVSTVADQYGVLPRSMSEALRSKKSEELLPHEAVLRTFSYFSRIEREEHAIVRDILERSVREAPDHADSWALLAMIYRGEFAQGFNTRPNPLDRALEAARRAVDLAPTHALGHSALATIYFFRKEMVAFRIEAERALELNPFDASVKAYHGLLIAASGEWDRGCELVESALQLNPNCPGFFYFARCWNAYRQGKYEEVLEGVARINMPSYFHVPAIKAAALAQLGRREEAQKALQEALALRPDFAATARYEYGKWYDDEHVEQVMDGLRKAGLEIPNQ